MSDESNKFESCKDCAILQNYRLLTYAIVALAVGKEVFDLIAKFFFK